MSETEFNVNKSSLVRVIHNRANPVVQLNKQALWDKNLSLRAVGLLARCLSLPDNYIFNISELISQCKEGKDAIYTAMKEIVNAGYGIRIQYQLVLNGRYIDAGVEYVFFESLATEQEKLDQLDIFKKTYQHLEKHSTKLIVNLLNEVSNA